MVTKECRCYHFVFSW